MYLYSVFCVLNIQKLSKGCHFLLEVKRNHPYRPINALLDLPFQLEN